MSYDGTIKFDTKMDPSGFQSGANRLGDIVKGMGVFKLLSAGVNLVSASVDKAMGRIDTMEQFSRVMTTMTGDVELTNKALEDTKEVVTGTAYGLDVAAKSVQNFVSRGMEVQDATDTVRAWGDAVAFYGDGSNTTFSSVTDALSKMQTKGNVTMEHMEMLLNAGIPAIEMYGDAVGMTASEVTDAMSKGELKASDFVGTMNTAMAQGTAKFPALAGAAKKAGASWSGTFDNMRAAITRGVQNIISAIDDTQTALGRPTMREGIAAFGKAFEKALNLVAKAITPVVKNLNTLVLSISAAVAAFGAVKVIAAFSKALNVARDAALAAEAVSGILTITTNKQALATAAATAAAQLGANATKEEIALHMASTGVITTKTFALGGLSTGMGLATYATTMLSAAVKSLTAAIVANPIGAIAVAAAAATAGVVALIGVLSTCGSKYQEQSARVKELTRAQKELADATNESRAAAEKNAAALEDNAKSAKTLLASMQALADKEHRSVDDKRMMAIYVNKLNDAQEGLNLTYDEQADLLSMDIEQLGKYLSAKQEMERFTANVERQNDLLKQQEEFTASLNATESELNAIRNAGYSELQEMWLSGDLKKSREEDLAQLAMIGDELATVQQDIANADTAAAQTIIDNADAERAASEAAAQATEEEMKRRQDAITSFTEAATNMFDAINTKSDVNAAQMIANLQKNREAMENYSLNLESLRDRFTELGLDDAVLEQLANMGTEGIAYVAALAKGTDEELKALAPAYAANVEAGNAAGIASIQAGYPDFEAAAAGANDAAAQGLDESQVRVQKEVKTVVVNVKAAAEQQVKASDFPSIGEMITAGIAEGIRNGASAIVEAAKEAVTAAMEAARATAEINSPSRRTRREIGRPWAQGISLGIEDETKSVAAHAVEMLAQINEAAERGAFGPQGVHGLIQQFRAAVDYNHSLPGLRGGMPSVAIQAAGTPAYGPVSNNQTFNFYQPVETPDETARAIRLQTTYGLAGDVG